MQRAETVAAGKSRIQSVDVLRGIVMVIMAIDHVRDFFHADAMHFSPEDLSHTNGAIFFTRWITHFCAPVFVFLAGTSASLTAQRGKPLREVSWLLFTRGLWLVVVEMVLVLPATTFNLRYDFIVWQVIWAIGWSMVALSALIHLPWRVLLVFSLAMIAGHNLLDGIPADRFGSLAWLWQILHVGLTPIPLTQGHTALVVYPLIPWIGVMSAGYCFGRVMGLPGERRRALLVALGVTLTVGFVVLRFVNGYGDPDRWATQATPTLTLISFFRASKYPPSLLYLLMTLGPALLCLAALDRIKVGERNPFLVFGKVPFFYYIAHWYTLHTVALVLAWFRYGRFDFLFQIPPSFLPVAVGFPPDYGYSLSTTYVIWAAIVLALYPLCLWFARVKARNRSAVLSYL